MVSLPSPKQHGKSNFHVADDIRLLNRHAKPRPIQEANNAVSAHGRQPGPRDNRFPFFRNSCPQAARTSAATLQHSAPAQGVAPNDAFQASPRGHQFVARPTPGLLHYFDLIPESLSITGAHPLTFGLPLVALPLVDFVPASRKTAGQPWNAHLQMETNYIVTVQAFRHTGWTGETTGMPWICPVAFGFGEAYLQNVSRSANIREQWPIAH